MSPKRRLLIVTDSLSGGLGGVVAQQVEWFTAAGWSVRVAARGPGPEFELPIPLDTVSIPYTVRRPRELAIASRQLRVLCSAWPPSIVHCHGLRSFMVAALAGRRAIAHLHGSGRIPSNPSVLDPLRRAALRALPSVAPAAFSASPELGKGWTFAPVPSPKLASLPQLDFPDSDGVPTFLWMGRLAEQKRADMFVEALAIASRTVPMRGLVAGTGPAEPELRLRAHELGVPIEFLGQRDDVVPLLRDAWAVVLLTRFEGMPLAVEEAMWAGRTVLGSRIPPLEWLVDGAGILVDTMDEAIDALLRLTDASHARALGACAAERVRALISVDGPWPEIEAGYERLLGR